VQALFVGGMRPMRPAQEAVKRARMWRRRGKRVQCRPQFLRVASPDHQRIGGYLIRVQRGAADQQQTNQSDDHADDHDDYGRCGALRTELRRKELGYPATRATIGSATVGDTTRPGRPSSVSSSAALVPG
jgi:hypothetical protein